MERIAARSNNTGDENGQFVSSEVVYDGLDLFRKGKKLKNILDAPGVALSKYKCMMGWDGMGWNVHKNIYIYILHIVLLVCCMFMSMVL